MWRVTIGSTSFDDCRRHSVDAAASFHTSGHADVAEIGQAYELLSRLLGLGIASTLFAIALLASGLNSTVTATLAGQIVMEGFLRLRLPNWARRLVTRGIAIVPVVVVIALYGERGTRTTPRLQSGHPVDAIAICSHSAGAVCLGSAKDG
jgi:NRAMP (natural resistance-associated macrophage protein)-like metal ion transporter